jgi:Xaa-Pro aminopeptidase
MKAHDTPLLQIDRRMRLAQKLGPNALAIQPTAPSQARNGDNHFDYRFDSSFFYLSGFTEPEAWLFIETDAQSQPKSTLVLRPKDELMEIWNGYRLGADAAPATLGLDAAFALDELDAVAQRLIAGKRCVWFPFHANDNAYPGLPARVHGWVDAVRSNERMGGIAPCEQRDLAMLVDDMRLIKDDAEIALMQRSGEIAAAAHVRAMRTSAAHFRGDMLKGERLREYHLEAELLHEFRFSGATGPAYGSIVAAGANACVLHYAAGNTAIAAGDLVLIDAGCEYGGYASDITRTFPADGRFTPAQRELYDIVVAAQEASIAAAKPGARHNEVHDASVRVLAQGMLRVGLLNEAEHGDLENVIAQQHYRQFYMHGTSHYLGLDVHDCGTYHEPGEEHLAVEKINPKTQQPYLDKPRRILQPGMVITIEPGIYVRAAPGVPERFVGIGIRIEDDALITSNGCELLTRGVPVLADEIEALMKG